MKKEGLRYNQGKNRLDLVPSDVIAHAAMVFTAGANKYEDRNWEHGMEWKNTIGSLKRHLNKFESGEDYDGESGLHHMDHVLVNAMFMSRYVRAFPEKDDRYLPFIHNHKSIGLDIDGVIANFADPFVKRLGLEGKGSRSWYMSYKAKDNKVWSELMEDKDFWMNLEPLIDPDSLIFEPTAYITARTIPVEWTQEWLEKNGFPCNNVITVGANGIVHESKVDVVKEAGIDIFIDDHYKHFIELNQAGVKCYLQDTNYNARYPVGSLRIKHPNDVLQYFPPSY